MNWNKLLAGIGAIALGSILIFGTMGFIRYGAGQDKLIKTSGSVGSQGGTEQSLNVVVTGYNQSNAHKGLGYYSSQRFDLGATDVTGLVFTNSSTTDEAHLHWAVSSSGQTEGYLIKAPVGGTTAATNGGLVEVNRTQMSALSSLATVANAVDGLVAGGTVWDVAIVVADRYVGGERIVAPGQMVGVSILSYDTSNEVLAELFWDMIPIGQAN